MPSDSSLSVRFAAQDVISAQRLRFLMSTRLKWVVGLWLALELAILVKVLFPNLAPWATFASWGLVVGMVLAFVLILALFYWLAPWMDYTRNPIWQTPFVIKMTDQCMVLSMEGKDRSVTVDWPRIRRLHENERAYIIYLKNEADFLILPKSIFHDETSAARFRRYLKKKSSLPEKVKERLT